MHGDNAAVRSRLPEDAQHVGIALAAVSRLHSASVRHVPVCQSASPASMYVWPTPSAPARTRTKSPCCTCQADRHVCSTMQLAAMLICWYVGMLVWVYP